MTPMAATVEPPPVPQRRRTWLRLALALAAVALLPVGVEAYRVVFGANVHTVLPGRVYRCAQPSGDDLDHLIARYHIRSVINLRGACDGVAWYADECRATNRHDVSLHDINFSASRYPSATELRYLLDVLDHAEYPILLHCRRGADRTGMTAMMALLLQKNVSLQEARRQLGPRYGHVAVGRTAALDEFADFYEDWLRSAAKAHTPDTFRDWVLHHYVPGTCWSRLSMVEPVPEARCGRPVTLKVRATNTSLGGWRLAPVLTAGVHLGCYVFDAEDRQLDTVKTGLRDGEVLPGQAVDFVVQLPAFRKPGRYRLMLDMVDEQQCWFYQTGSAPLEQELIVRE
jgi:hypothetical protein